MSDADLVREYYRAIDGDDYEQLQGLLAPAFVQVRPDRTLDGRERFIRFMRDERPQGDTTHPLDALYEPIDGDGEVVARGRLLGADGAPITGFVDVFEIEADRLSHLTTYTD
jgi:ketosteroid isomerase-like protein